MNSLTLRYVYHGGMVVVKEPEIIRKKIKTRDGIVYKKKDFGDGFHTTYMLEQAVSWSNTYPDGVVSAYEFDLEKTRDLKVLYFPTMTEEWLDFIVDCRVGEKHDYDIVEGPMADDKIYTEVYIVKTY